MKSMVSPEEPTGEVMIRRKGMNVKMAFCVDRNRSIRLGVSKLRIAVQI